MATNKQRLLPLLFSLAVVVGGCELSEAEKAPDSAGATPPANVSTLKIQTRDVALQYEYVGQVAASREVEIRARVTGIIDKRFYQEGRTVNEGDLLFKLEPSAYEVQLAQSEAEQASARAELKRAEREYRRIKPLLAKNLVSQNQIDDAESARDLARASVKLAQARVKSAAINLGYTEVSAPIRGIAGRALKVEGGLAEVGNNSLLTTLAQIDPVYINFGIAEAKLLNIRRETREGKITLPQAGFRVALYSSSGDDLDHYGKLDFQDYKVDTRTGNFAMRATVNNPDGLLAPGQFVKVQLQGAVRENAIVLPQRSVQDDPKGKFVYVVSSGKEGGSIALKRHIEVGEWVNNVDGINKAWVIRSGLKPDDEVVVDGAARIFFPGMAVKSSPYGEKVTAEKKAAMK